MAAFEGRHRGRRPARRGRGASGRAGHRGRASWSASTRAAARSRPGLIDPHTHLLFAGTRHAELELRQRGVAYLDILAAGGGILQTVRQTRAASDDELLANGRRWLAEMLSHGVTTVEAKSGYGLDVPTELRLLAVAAPSRRTRARSRSCQRSSARTPSRRSSATGPTPLEAYLDHVINEQLPAVAEQGIARLRRLLRARRVRRAGRAGCSTRPRELGLALRLHADEIHPSGAAELAAELARSRPTTWPPSPTKASRRWPRAAEAGRPVVATLLPATDLLPDEPTTTRRRGG